MNRQHYVLRFTSVIALTCIGAMRMAPAQPAQFPSTISLHDLLDRYGRGEYALARQLSPEALRGGLQNDGRAWVAAQGPATEPRRRLIAASLALEAAGHRFSDWTAAKELIEAGCLLLRETPAPLDGERLWHLASVALVQRLYDSPFLIGALARTGERHLPETGTHLDHAAQRFPDEGRFLLAHAVALEVETWPQPTTKTPDGPTKVRLLNLVRSFEPLLSRSGVAAEARLRLGHTYLRLAQPDVALTHLRQVEAAVREPFLTYLAAYFAGRAHAARGNRGAAMAAYRHSLTIVPRAQSASLALASIVFAGEDRDDAFGVVESAVSTTKPAADPWRLYATGDYRFWPFFIELLRKEFK